MGKVKIGIMGFGYYGIRVNGDKLKNRRGVHRVSWFIHHGVWPTKNVCHTCDRKACIRPDHLFEGDQIDNMRDCKAKGRTRGGRPNGRYMGKFRRFNDSEISNIRERLANGETIKDLKEEFKCSRTILSYLKNGRRGYSY